ncbi:MAG: DUF885 domain-containing protein, partial [Betaproteobacteria bacterium]
MFRFALLLVACLAASIATPLQAQPTQALNALFADEWERSLRDSPEFASYQGDTRYADRWTDFSPAAIAARQAADRAALDRLHAIARAALAPADQLNYDTFEWLLQHNIERQKFRETLQPINHQGGPQIADGIAETMPFATTTDYRRWLARMAAVPTLIDQAIALMQDGVKAGNMPPRVLMQRVPAQIAAQIVDDATVRRRDPDRRPRRIARRCANHGARQARARVSQAAGVLQQRVPAANPPVDLGRRAAEWQGLLRLPVALLHDGRLVGRRDPCDRPERGRTHSRRDGEDEGRDRLQRHARRVLQLPAQRPEVFSQDARRIARRLSRDIEAHRPGTREGRQDHSAPALRRARDPRQH